MTDKKILIIEDDPDIVEATKTVLEAEGYKVFSASNKREGTEKITEIFPDLIIMDVMMEKMSDGFDLTRKLKSDVKYKSIPILMITSVGDVTGFHFRVEAGNGAWLPVDGFIEKPVTPEELLFNVEKLLPGKH